ncbi:pyridoxal phosphate-dependent transferase [Aspergillus avenaceus]|uniref:Pyridoxal phosphate-dependent transferase n=1 Tax=Aspergillus avenaceus TaxID=36643 RepID=A0A5N6TXL3_ASPAV|nr:pyridoxal phosphate-dependent transferase [Aspergillus avenaceus]
MVGDILNDAENCRRYTYPQEENAKHIPERVKTTDGFTTNARKLANVVRQAAHLISDHTSPFWSPRYQTGTSDPSIIALAGQLLGVMYNVDNATAGASPLAQIAERLVVEQLCDMVGFDSGRGDLSRASGHMTSDSATANLEALHIARDLKIYPLALLYKASKGPEDDPICKAIRDVKVRKCSDNDSVPQQPLTRMTTWDVLNLTTETILSIPKQLNDACGISQKHIEYMLKEYFKDHFMVNADCGEPEEEEKDKQKKEEINLPGDDLINPLKVDHTGSPRPKHLASTTWHNIPPNTEGLTGIRSTDIERVDIDKDCRLSIKELETRLDHFCKMEQPVYAVVVTIGSSNEGAVDSLSEVLEQRENFKRKGLYFPVHVDATEGGYFTSIVSSAVMKGEKKIPLFPATGLSTDLALKIHTQLQLRQLPKVESVTLDPGRSGVVPNQAGVLLYRYEGMKYLRESSSDSSNFVGSKHGAAAIATWLANETIGLHPNGFGAHFKEISMSSARIAAHLTAGIEEDDPFICVPLNEPPNSLGTNGTEIVQSIRESILSSSNKEIRQCDCGITTMHTLRAVGPDLNTNVFALNWREANDHPNKDVERANYFMRRIAKRFSASPLHQKTTGPRFHLSLVEFTPGTHKAPRQDLLRRLGLHPEEKPILALRNIVTSPFPLDRDFVHGMMQEFRQVAKEEAEVSRRGLANKAVRQFLMQGTEEIFLVMRTCFFQPNLRNQVILQVSLNEEDLNKYKAFKTRSGSQAVFLKTIEEIVESDLQANRQFKGELYNVLGAGNHVDFRILNVLPVDVDHEGLVDIGTPFLVYGEKQKHLTHLVGKAPNFELYASNITLEPERSCPRGAVLLLSDIPETIIQPFSVKDNTLFSDPNRRFSCWVLCPQVNAQQDTGESDRRGSQGNSQGGSPAGTQERTQEQSPEAPVPPPKQSRANQPPESLRDTQEGDSDSIPLEYGEAVLTLGNQVYLDDYSVNNDPNYIAGKDEVVTRQLFDQIRAQLK